jgi:SAM-dependent methyltransferase
MNGSARHPTDFYRAHAATFAAARRDNGSEGDWIEVFVAALPPGASVLYAGCGTGEPIARKLAEAGLQVTGFDTTLAFIALARERLPQAEFLKADLRSFDLARTFDGVIAWHSLFHLGEAEQRAALPRLTRHTAPGGVLMFTSGTEAGESANPCFGEPLYHASLDPAEYRAILEGLGFTVMRYSEADPAAGDATVWLARRASG